jgi:ActR/RegA family two-component response regulator
MGGREIIIADGDTRYRSQVTDFFKRSGYRVETADSVEQVLASVRENMAQVLLLGSGFSTKIAASDLIHLLKKCSRQLHIILVSDGMTLAQARRVRQEGIFYQALKPATGSDTEELGQAVACAFRKQRASILIEPDPGLQGQQSRKTTPDAALLMSSLSWTVPLVALLFATSYYFLAPAAEKAHNGTSVATLIFLSFFALIVVTQLLPIFRSDLACGIRAHHAAHKSMPRGRKLAAFPE